MIIYKIENLINGKLYIGKTKKCLAIRKKEHLFSAKKEVNTVFYKAIRKYGEENFQFTEIISCDSNEKLNAWERLYIDFYDSKTPNGYNMTNGGDGFSDPTGEIAKKISASKIGKICSDETKKKMSKSQLKAQKRGSESSAWIGANEIRKCRNKECAKTFEVRPNDSQQYCNRNCMNKDLERIRLLREHIQEVGKNPEAREKISQSLKGKPSWNKGLKLSEDHVKKLSLSHMGHKPTEETKQKMRDAHTLLPNYFKPFSNLCEAFA
jgi:group I intron endonuclease